MIDLFVVTATLKGKWVGDFFYSTLEQEIVSIRPLLNPPLSGTYAPDKQ